jgi:hypothetical protein
METVLDTPRKRYDGSCPVVCMDEQPVQLLKETRKPIPATKTHTKGAFYAAFEPELARHLVRLILRAEQKAPFPVGEIVIDLCG